MGSSRGQSRATNAIVAAIVWTASIVCAQDHAPEPQEYEFYGAFEQTSVQLNGRGLPELYAACTDFLRKSGVEPIDEVEVEGRHFVRTTGYFDRQQVCGFVALNARLPGSSLTEAYETPLLTGSVSGMPFRLWPPREEAAEAARRFMPLAIGDMRIGKVIVDGAHQPHAGAWSADEVVAVIERHLVPSPPLAYAVDRGPRRGSPWSALRAWLLSGRDELARVAIARAR